MGARRPWAVCVVLVGLLSSLATAHLKASREGSWQYEAELHDSGDVAWLGGLGAWKQGSWNGTADVNATAALLVDAAQALSGASPAPPNVTGPVEWAVTLALGKGPLVRVTDGSPAALVSLVARFELLLNSASWVVPQDSPLARPWTSVTVATSQYRSAAAVRRRFHNANGFFSQACCVLYQRGVSVAQELGGGANGQCGCAGAVA